MARIARVVVPGIPHHITQRGNRRMQTFFNNHDYQVYVRLMAQWRQEFQVKVWASGLMPSHVHMIAVREREGSLRRGMVRNWRDFLDRKDEQREFGSGRRHVRTGRPLGEEGFIEGLERLLQRTLRPPNHGPKEKDRIMN